MSFTISFYFYPAFLSPVGRLDYLCASISQSLPTHYSCETNINIYLLLEKRVRSTQETVVQTREHRSGLACPRNRAQVGDSHHLALLPAPTSPLTHTPIHLVQPTLLPDPGDGMAVSGEVHGCVPEQMARGLEGQASTEDCQGGPSMVPSPRPSPAPETTPRDPLPVLVVSTREASSSANGPSASSPGQVSVALHPGDSRQPRLQMEAGQPATRE